MDVYTKAARGLLNLSSDMEIVSMLREVQIRRVTDIMEALDLSIRGLKKAHWFIEANSVEADDAAPITVRAKVRKSGSDSKKEIEDSTMPPFDDYEVLSVDEHGGEGYGQQSIVILVEEVGGSREEPRKAEIQIEVDMSTGDFDGDSLSSWEIIEGDEEE